MTNKAQRQAVLAILEHATKPLPLSALTYSASSVSERTIRRWLELWTKDGLIEKVGNGKATCYQYLKPVKATNHSPNFLTHLDPDLGNALLQQLRDLWTHHSTAMEGNTLSLGDTHFLLEEGLTISGKPLKDHQEVLGHAKAIELLHQHLSQPVSINFIFELHKAIQTSLVTDIYKPIGAWKVEHNGTYATTSDGQQTFIEYAAPDQVPALMDELIAYMNPLDEKSIRLDNAHQYYAKIHMGFVHIHPFWDGNGRMARLLANLPLLKAGLPPLVIPREERMVYTQTLADYQMTAGRLTSATGVWPTPVNLNAFDHLCQSAYHTTQKLVRQAQHIQNQR